MDDESITSREANSAPKKGRKTKDELRSGLNTLAAQQAQACLRVRSELDEDEIEEIPRPDIPMLDQLLTPEVEEISMAAWNESPEKASYQALDFTTHTRIDLRDLWKVSLRVFQYSPVVLISTVNQLKYQPVDNNGLASQYIFSRTFCHTLASLITHPCWNWEPREFILALQYTVKCRLNDHHPWPASTHDYPCPALETLRSMFDDVTDEHASLPDMHISARQCLFDEEPSPFSDFLLHIGETVRQTTFTNIPQVSHHHLGMLALPVTIQDLRALQNAVNTMPFSDESLRCKVKDVYNAYKVTKTTDVAVVRNLRGLLERSGKYIYRMATIARLSSDASDLQTNQAPTDGDNDPDLIDENPEQDDNDESLEVHDGIRSSEPRISDEQDYKGTGLGCMVVVLRRIIKHIVASPKALTVNTWIDKAEDDNPILHYAWGLFEDSEEERTQARALANTGLVEVFGHHMEPDDILFEQLCVSSLMNETFWSQDEFSLFRPPVFLDTCEMVEQTPDEAIDANMLEFDQSDHPEATLQDFVNSKFGVINQIFYRPREPIVIRLLYRTGGLGGHHFDSLRQFFVPMFLENDISESQSHYSLIAMVKMRMTMTSPDSVRTYPDNKLTVDDPLSGDYMLFYGLCK
ncbi:hypothetical protein NW762_011197 [Fusarium torreyae]|uniref:Uncharacterized protein n=1 Tax=Fusarium torreyae TaxID=1237075 RepID=A0A9W8RRE3_9HYPO|nr:hypothetical protein NW762_011197 [Fusarium torreyae]